MYLSWISKGILEREQKIFFSYLWRGNKEQNVMPWLRWEMIAILKALGEWGLNFFFLFSKAMVAKGSWRLITTTSIWMRVVHKKYIAPLSIMDWVRSNDKRKSSYSEKNKTLFEKTD
jgi:hypothetical protein